MLDPTHQHVAVERAIDVWLATDFLETMKESAALMGISVEELDLQLARKMRETFERAREKVRAEDV